jgi:hypothetical protein
VRWVPRWADRFLPHIDIEGARASEGGSAERGGRRGRGHDSMKL